MHNNLIKVNEMLAFARNNDGVTTLLLKRTNDYSFEDIINKEREIDKLSIDLKNKNEESENVVINNAKLKKEFISSVFYMICAILAGIIYSELIVPFSEVNIFRRFLLFLLFTSFALYLPHINPIKEYKKYKNETKNPEEVKENLEKVRELLNTKKEELEKVLDKVDFREYSNKDEIESIISNMFRVTSSNEYYNILSKDVSNKVTLDGPTLNRRKDV